MQNFRKVTIYQTGKEGDPDQIFFNWNFSRNTKISLIHRGKMLQNIVFKKCNAIPSNVYLVSILDIFISSSEGNNNLLSLFIIFIVYLRIVISS